MTRRFLYIDAHRLSAWHWSSGQIVNAGIFENTSDGLARFSDYLYRNAGSPLILLANSPEEGYQQEIIPYLKGADRTALIARRLSQHFFSTPYTTAIPLGYEKDQRRNERVLLTALSNPAHLEPWLVPLVRAEAPLPGLYSLAQLGGPLLQRIGHDPHRCLLLTFQDNSLRESFIVRGVTLFSRVAPVQDSSVAAIAAAFAAEARKLHQYLLGQRLAGRNETMTAFILAHPGAMQAIRNSCIDSGNLRFEIVDTHVAAKKTGLRSPPADSRCEPLFLHQLATQKPAQQFLRENFRHDHRLLLLKRTLLAFTGFSVAIAIAFAGWKFVAAERLLAATAAQTQQEQLAQRRYQEITATFPKVQIGNDALRQVIGRYAELQRTQDGPLPFYIELAQILDNAGSIEILAIEWKLGAIDKKGGREESAIVTGEIRPGSKATARQILSAFEELTAMLAKRPGWRIAVERSPFDIGSGQAVKGGGSSEQLQQHPFRLLITRKVPA